MVTPGGPLVLPTPTSGDKGTVGGVFIRRIPGQPDEPITEVHVFLATIVSTTNGKPTMAGLDKVKAPKAYTDAAGRFVILDVPAGSYGVIYETPTRTLLLKQPGTSEDWVIEVKGGQVLDLGTDYLDIQ